MNGYGLKTIDRGRMEMEAESSFLGRQQVKAGQGRSRQVKPVLKITMQTRLILMLILKELIKAPPPYDLFLAGCWFGFICPVSGENAHQTLACPMTRANMPSSCS